jgi:hypothetical protein
MGLHVARYFRQGVAEFATDQTGVWADLVVACGGRASRVPVLQGLLGNAKNLGDVLSAEEWAKGDLGITSAV